MSSFTKKSAGTTRTALLTALLAVFAGSVALAPDAAAALCDRHKATLFGVKEDNSPGPCKDCVREREEAAERARREQAERALREAEARRLRENPPPPVPVPPADGSETRRAQSGSGDPRSQSAAPATSAAPAAAEINHLFSGTIWAMPSNKTFAIAFYRDGLYYQENGSVNNFFRSVWKPGPPTTAFTDKATFIIDSRTIRNGVLIPGVSKMEKHSLDGVKDLWVFVRYVQKTSPPVVCTKCQKSPCVCARPSNDFKTVTLPGGVKLEMVWIRPGTFMMGSPTSEKERGSWQNDETLHQVTISKGYWLGKYEVTQSQWKAVMGTDVRGQFRRGHDWGDINGVGNDHPIYFVNWNEAKEFCARLTDIEQRAGRLPRGYKYALPTEAQWEYACRAGTKTPFALPFTTSTTNYDTVMKRVGWFLGNSGGRTHPVGKKTANPWGLYDMHGNVWEWVEDAVANYPRGPVTDPCNTTGGVRVGRGGSWSNSARRCRAAIRGAEPVGIRRADYGFRAALAPERQ